MALTLRLPEEDEKSLKSLADKVGLMPIDLVRAAVRGMLTAAERNGGQVVMPVHVRTKAEENEWGKLCAALHDLSGFRDAESNVWRVIGHVLNKADSFAHLAALPGRPKDEPFGYESPAVGAGVPASPAPPPPPPASGKLATKRDAKKK